MTAFDVRLASTQRGTWPGEMPALRRLEPTTVLLVPLGGREGQVIAVRPAGTAVRPGDMLTETAPEVGHVPVAPVEGTLGAVRNVVVAGGVTVPAVELVPAVDAVGSSAPEAAGPSADAGVNPPPGPETELTRADLPGWIDRLRRAGIHADRIASPDLIAQLQAVLRRPVDTLLCSALDGDPPMRLLAGVALERADELVAGIVALRNVCGAGAAAVVIDDSAPARWTRRLRKSARDNGVRVIGLANDYPQGDPTLLIYGLLDRKLRFRRLPVEQGVVVVDAIAASAVGQFVRSGRPMTHVPVGVFDHSLDRQRPQDRMHYVEAPIGMRIEDLLAQLIADVKGSTIRTGDLLRDRQVEADAVVGGAECVLHLVPHEPGEEIEPCIRCGWCVQGCPTRVQPAGLLEAAQRDDLRLAEHYGLESCIECGICSFVCPSQLPLLGGIRHLRTLRRV